jgi:hypothetical protein
MLDVNEALMPDYMMACCAQEGEASAHVLAFKILKA